MVLTLKTTRNLLKFAIVMKLCKQTFASIDAKKDANTFEFEIVVNNYFAIYIV